MSVMLEKGTAGTIATLYKGAGRALWRRPRGGLRFLVSETERLWTSAERAHFLDCLIVDYICMYHVLGCSFHVNLEY